MCFRKRSVSGRFPLQVPRAPCKPLNVMAPSRPQQQSGAPCILHLSAFYLSGRQEVQVWRQIVQGALTMYADVPLFATVMHPVDHRHASTSGTTLISRETICKLEVTCHAGHFEF